jgi:hypothetical protein
MKSKAKSQFIGKTLISILMLFLSSCSCYWYNSNKTIDQAYNDCQECDYEAVKFSYVPYNAFTSPTSAGVQSGFQKAILFEKCMKSRGYQYILEKYLPPDVNKSKYQTGLTIISIAGY